MSVQHVKPGMLVTIDSRLGTPLRAAGERWFVSSPGVLGLVVTFAVDPSVGDPQALVVFAGEPGRLVPGRDEVRGAGMNDGRIRPGMLVRTLALGVVYAHEVDRAGEITRWHGVSGSDVLLVLAITPGFTMATILLPGSEVARLQPRLFEAVPR